MSTRFQVPSVPRVSGTSFLGLILAVVLILVLGGLILGFSLMIFVGILWGEFGWLAPIGFGPAFGIAFFGSIILASVRAVNAGSD